MAYTDESNARTLQAWNAWKDVCWVHGIGRPRGDLPVVGTQEDEKILAGMISNAFKRKISKFRDAFKRGSPSDGNPFPGGDCKNPFDDADFAQEFDCALHEYELSETPGHERYRKGHFGDFAYVRKAKAWKDCVWDAAADSDDPPLKVINGKLLGPHGVINQIAEEWLLANYSCRFEGKMLVLDRSRDAPAQAECAVKDFDDPQGYLESTASNAISPEPPEENADEAVCRAAVESGPANIPRTWLQELEDTFPPRICCIILAHINRVMLYKEPDILAALGIKKTAASGELKRLRSDSPEVLSRLNPELRDWLICDAAGTRFFKKWIEKRCEPEKAGKLILSRIAGKANAAK